MDALFYAFVVFLFAAVILAIEGTYLWWMGTHGAPARSGAAPGRRWHCCCRGAA
jgi:hypothetical protein